MAQFCTGCGASLKEGSRFCENCGRPAAIVQAAFATPVAAAPVARVRGVVGQRSPDGKWWWNGTQWMAVPQVLAPMVAPRKRMGLGKRLLLGFGVAGVALVVILILVAKFGPLNNPSAPIRPLGPGPYYAHYTCGGNSSCISTVVNEATANGGDTGIIGDYKDMASCSTTVTLYTGIVKTAWCSTSRNAGDTGP